LSREAHAAYDEANALMRRIASSMAATPGSFLVQLSWEDKAHER
jgi:hypothetical protein